MSFPDAIGEHRTPIVDQTLSARASRVHLPMTSAGRVLVVGTMITLTLIALAQVNASGQATLWENLHWSVSALAATIAGALGARRASGRERSVRTAATFALALWTAGNLLWSTQLASGTVSFPSIADLFGVAVVIPVLAILVGSVHGRLTRAEEAAVYLDSALVATAILALLLIGFGEQAYAVSGLAGILSLGYPLEYLAIGGAGMVALVAMRHRVSAGGGFALFAGAAVIGLAYLGWTIPIATGAGQPGELAGHLFSVGALLMGLGAATWVDDIDTSPRYETIATWLTRGIGPLAAGIALLTLLWHPAEGEAIGSPLRLTIVVGGALFLLRQGLLLRERSQMLVEVRALHEENDGLVDTLRDELTERARVQDQLIESSRMAAVGELAAGVAHEVNNPLTGVLGYAELLLLDLEDTDPHRADVEVIRDEALRARSIVRALRDYARPTDTRPAPTDLTALVGRTLDLLRYSLARTNVIVTERHDELPPVELDPQAIQQVLLNVLTNAMQAMPDGGTLEIVSARDGNDASLSITDTGAGMTDAAISQAFIPFFTTRQTAGGAGLGLAVGKKLVESHGGSIKLRSQIGHGTTVEIRLPLAPLEDTADALLSASATGSVARRES